MSVDILAIALIFGFIPLLVLVCVLVMALFGAGRSRKASVMRQEEAALLHAIHDGLVRLEQRVDALETLLGDTRTASRPSRSGGR